jgi:hypothetical protein
VFDEPGFPEPPGRRPDPQWPAEQTPDEQVFDEPEFPAPPGGRPDPQWPIEEPSDVQAARTDGTRATDGAAAPHGA